MVETESLFSKWARLGVSFPAFEPSTHEPRLEQTIAATSIVGRYEPRLLESLAGWLSKHGDLVNVSLMHKELSNADSGVIGIVLDSINSPQSSKLHALTRYCSPKEKDEPLFHSSATSPSALAAMAESESELNRKWHLYFGSFRIKTNAVRDRSWVLSHNPDLARRAIFGHDLRTEILNFLIRRKTSFPAEIAKTLGYQYHRVHLEIEALCRDSVVTSRSETKRRILRLTPAFRRYFTSLPYCSALDGGKG